MDDERCDVCGSSVFSEYHIQVCDHDDLNDLESYIRRNDQVHGVNIRDFLRAHHSPPLGTSPREISILRRMTHPITESSAPHTDYEANIALSERIGKVEIGVTNINKISTFSDNDGNSQDVCVICQDIVRNKQRQLTCFHTFCAVCIEKWLSKHKTCPTCKAILE